MSTSHEPENGFVISNGLRNSGSWAVSRSVRNTELSMNLVYARIVLECGGKRSATPLLTGL
jgi:hypothetical protein